MGIYTTAIRVYSPFSTTEKEIKSLAQRSALRTNNSLTFPKSRPLLNSWWPRLACHGPRENIKSYVTNNCSLWINLGDGRIRCCSIPIVSCRQYSQNLISFDLFWDSISHVFLCRHLSPKSSAIKIGELTITAILWILLQIFKPSSVIR